MKNFFGKKFFSFIFSKFVWHEKTMATDFRTKMRSVSKFLESFLKVSMFLLNII